MDVLYPCCAGLDVHKDTVVACSRTASGGAATSEVRTFATTTPGLLALSAWLAEHGCTHVAMKASGIYWKPVWHILADGEFTLILANAAHVKNTIDSQHPERTAINVVIHIASLTMAWENAADLLRSAAFFDAAHYPDARFTSTAVVPVSANHYIVKGNLEVRGVTRPIELDADLVEQHLDTQTGTEIGNFVVQGHLQRSAFGMTADSDFISDRVDLRISAHIQIVAPSG